MPHTSAPRFVDIDGDGDLDAFVGVENGQIVFSENTGSAVSPAFAAPRVDPFGLVDVGIYAAPAFVDIDGDGDLDAFVGDWSGHTYFFENTGTAQSPAFASPSVDPFFGLAGLGIASPTFADIDGDGDLDALVGDGDGDTIFFENTGTARSPAFAAPISDPFGLAAVHMFATPAFADVDGDGDLDALVGDQDGDTIFFENTGSVESPAFAVPITDPFGLADVGGHASPTLADLDGDGDLDVFLGDIGGAIFLFENKGIAWLFVDGFESGDLAAWSSHMP